jgi:hypothetical protein
MGGIGLVADVPKPSTSGCRRVRVWFSSHVLVDRTGELPEIAHYYLGMKRRYASLVVTSEPVAQARVGPSRPRELSS